MGCLSQKPFALNTEDKTSALVCYGPDARYRRNAPCYLVTDGLHYSLGETGGNCNTSMHRRRDEVIEQATWWKKCYHGTHHRTRHKGDVN